MIESALNHTGDEEVCSTDSGRNFKDLSESYGSFTGVCDLTLMVILTPV